MKAGDLIKKYNPFGIAIINESILTDYMEEYASIKLSEAKSQMRDKIVKELEEDIKEDDFILTDGYKYGVNTAISIVKEAMK
jgi:hypothetical protein